MRSLNRTTAGHSRFAWPWSPWPLGCTIFLVARPFAVFATVNLTLLGIFHGFYLAYLWKQQAAAIAANGAEGDWQARFQLRRRLLFGNIALVLLSLVLEM